MKGAKQEKVKQTAAKVKEAQKTSPKPKEKDKKDAAVVSNHEQKGKHSEEVARGSRRVLGKKQMQ